MAVTAKLYGQVFVGAFGKTIDFVNDSIKVALCASGYTPDQDTHRYYSDITNELPTGDGYTAGGKALTGMTLTYDAATNTTKLDADDVGWTDSTLTARYAVIYDDTPAQATKKPLLAYVDFGENYASKGSIFEIKWHTDGIVTVQVS